MKTNDSDIENDVVFNELSLGFRRYPVGAETGRLVLRHAEHSNRLTLGDLGTTFN